MRVHGDLISLANCDGQHKFQVSGDTNGPWDHRVSRRAELERAQEADRQEASDEGLREFDDELIDRHDGRRSLRSLTTTDFQNVAGINLSAVSYRSQTVQCATPRITQLTVLHELYLLVTDCKITTVVRAIQRYMYNTAAKLESRTDQLELDHGTQVAVVNAVTTPGPDRTPVHVAS